MEACLGIICASMPALKNSMQSCFHIVIDPFTYGSSRTNRRWKNPFYRSYEQSFHGYFKRSDRSNQGPNAPQNSYIGMRINCMLLRTHRLIHNVQGSYHSQWRDQSSSKGAEEIQVNLSVLEPVRRNDGHTSVA